MHAAAEPNLIRARGVVGHALSSALPCAFNNVDPTCCCSTQTFQLNATDMFVLQICSHYVTVFLFDVIEPDNKLTTLQGKT